MEFSEFITIFEIVGVFNVMPEKPIAISSVDTQKVMNMHTYFNTATCLYYLKKKFLTNIG